MEQTFVVKTANMSSKMGTVYVLTQTMYYSSDAHSAKSAFWLGNESFITCIFRKGVLRVLCYGWLIKVWTYYVSVFNLLKIWHIN